MQKATNADLGPALTIEGHHLRAGLGTGRVAVVIQLREGRWDREGQLLPEPFDGFMIEPIARFTALARVAMEQKTGLTMLLVFGGEITRWTQCTVPLTRTVQTNIAPEVDVAVDERREPRDISEGDVHPLGT